MPHQRCANLQVTVLQTLSSATPHHKATATAAVQAITCGSQTNLSGGLFEGLSHQLRHLAAQHADAGAPAVEGGRHTVHSAFLFTDGLANRGVTSAADISGAMRGMLEGESGADGRVSVHTFGFGHDHSGDFLATVSAAAAGSYYFVETAEHIPGAFADALGGLLSVAAQNATLTVTPCGASAIAAVHTSHEIEAASGGAHVVNVRDLYAEERKDVIVEIALPPVTVEEASAGFTVAQAELAYTDVVAGAIVKRRAGLTLQRAAPPVPEAARNVRVALHAARISAAAGMREALDLADRGRHYFAHKRLGLETLNVTTLLETAPAGDGDAAGAAHVAALRGIRADLRRCESRVRSKAAYDGGGQLDLCSTMMRHRRQRNNGAGYTLSIAATSVPQEGDGDSSPVAANKPTPARAPPAAAPPPPPPPVSPRDGGACFGGLLARVRRHMGMRGRRARGQEASRAVVGGPALGGASSEESGDVGKRARDDVSSEAEDAMAAGDQYATRRQSLMVQEARLSVLSGTGTYSSTSQGALPARDGRLATVSEIDATTLAEGSNEAAAGAADPGAEPCV